jgi:hypothetical protein
MNFLKKAKIVNAKKESRKQRNQRLRKASKTWEDFIKNTKEGQDMYKAAQEMGQIQLDYVFEKKV